MIKFIVVRESGLAKEYRYMPKIDYIPEKGTRYVNDWYESVWPLFVKNHPYGYTADDIYSVYIEITNRLLKDFNNESNKIGGDYLKISKPEIFATMKYWPLKHKTVGSLVNEQFFLLKNALLKSRKVVDKDIKEKDGTIRTEQVTIYIPNFIDEFEDHVRRNGKLLGTFWDYRDIKPDIVDASISCRSECIEAKKNYVAPQSNLTNEELRIWAKEKFNI